MRRDLRRRRRTPGPPTSGPPGSPRSPRRTTRQPRPRVAVRARARLPGPQPAHRGRADRAVRERRRRRCSASSARWSSSTTTTSTSRCGAGGFRGRVIPEGEDGLAGHLQPGPDRPLLRPDRHLRRPRRGPRRGLSAGRRRRRAAPRATDADGGETRRRGDEADDDEADEDEADDDEAEPPIGRQAGASRRGDTSPSAPSSRLARAAMRLAGAELLDSREILPGQWLQAYPRAGARRRRPRRPVRPRPDRRLLRAGPAPAVLVQHDRPRRGHAHDPLPDRSVAGPSGSPRLRPGRSRRHARAARAAVRGRSADRGTSCSIAGGLGHGRRARARRRGDPRRPPGDAAVRRRERARRLPVVAAARRGRVRRRDRRRLRRPPRLRDGARARVRGVGRPGVRLRAAADARGPRRARRRRGGGGWAWRSLGRKRGAGRPIPAGSPAGAAEGVPPGLDGAEHGLRRRGVPRLRGDVDRTGTPQRVCREGPVFASEELDWEGGW